MTLMASPLGPLNLSLPVIMAPMAPQPKLPLPIQAQSSSVAFMT